MRQKGLGVKERFRALRTIHSENAAEIRRGVLELVREVADAELALWCGLVTDGGGPRVGEWQVAGPIELGEVMGNLSRRPELWPSQTRGNFLAPPRSHRTSFVLLEDILPRRELEASGFYEKMWRPVRIVDQSRLLVTHDQHVIGLIGVFRRAGAKLFSRGQAWRLTLGVPEIGSALVAADVLDANQTSKPAYLIVTSRGAVTCASGAAAAAWLERPGFRESLQRAVRDFDANRAPEHSQLLLGAELRLLRLDGSRVRYLACLARAPRLDLSPLVALSPMQRRIADRAAAGMTISEISADLQRSPNTVKTQLKIVYDRLSVGTRLELARLLATRQP